MHTDAGQAGMSVGCPVCGSTFAEPVSLDCPRALLQCRECHLVYALVAADEWNAADYYDAYYSVASTEFDAITERRYRDLLARLERIHRRGRLLDVGCGAGHLLVTAEASGWSVVGQEVSASGLRWLRSLKTKSGASFELVDGDLLDAALTPGTFAAITVIEVIEHLPTPVAMLARCWSLLEPGGVLYLTTPNFDSVTRRLLGGKWRGLTQDHLCLFNVSALGHALTQAGFRQHRIVTKNLDLPEMLLNLGIRRRDEGGESVNAWAVTQQLRQTIERRPLLAAAKAMVNAGLRVTRSGDVLEGFAFKDRP